MVTEPPASMSKVRDYNCQLHSTSLGRHPRLGLVATYCFDLDLTLCVTDGTDYETSTPMMDRIKIVNRLFDSGHTIIIHTARGSASGLDFYDLTKAQLSAWGLKHHLLQLGKPAADYYIDDKGVNSEDFEW